LSSGVDLLRYVFLFDIVDGGKDRIMMDVERIKNIFFNEAD